MYKIKSLEITNFKSYKSCHLVSFDEHLNCIIGPNGSGKSNILDAIVFVLTNNTCNLRNTTVKLTLRNENTENQDSIMTFTRYINNSGKSSYFINNKKSVFKKYISNFIIYQSHTDSSLNNIIEQTSGSIKYKQEYDNLTVKYNDLIIKLKIETESRRQYYNLIKENKKYEEDYKRNLKLLDKKKEIEELLFHYKIQSLLIRYTKILDKKKYKENEILKNKKLLLANNIQELTFRINNKEDLLSKIEKDLFCKVNPVIPNFESLEKEYFYMLNNKECCKIEIEDEQVKILANEKDKLFEKNKNSIQILESLKNQQTNLELELSKINTEVLLSRNIKAKSIRLYNLKQKIRNLKGVVGFLNDLVKCNNNKYEIPVRALLSNYEYTVIVDTTESAYNCIKYCKDHKLGRISCIIMNTTKSYNIKKNNNKDLISPILVLNFEEKLTNVIENLFGNIFISNKVYPVNYNVDVCTIDGIILRSKGRFVNFYKYNEGDTKLERRMELVNLIEKIKQKIGEFNNIEIIQNKINKLESEIESRKIKKRAVLIPEVTIFGDLFINNGYKNYSDYVNRNSKYYKEEMECKKNLLLERKKKIEDKLLIDKKELEILKNEYDSIQVSDYTEGDVHDKEDIKTEIKDLYFIEKNEVCDVDELIERCTNTLHTIKISNEQMNKEKISNEQMNKEGSHTALNMTSNIANVDVTSLRSELENINKTLKSSYLLKNTTVLDYNSHEYDELKKRTLEVKAQLNAVKNQRTTCFMECIEKLNESISALYSKISGGTCSLVVENTEEPFNGVKYYVMVPNKKFKEYESLSGGEQMISRLVLMYALNKLSNNRFLLLDEIDSNLDSYNVNKLVKFMKTEDFQVVMVSLKILLFKECDKLIGVYKKDGISNVLHYKMS